MIVRFNKPALLTTTKESHAAIGVEGDPNSHPGKVSEVDKIVGDARRKVNEEGVPGVGVSGSNSGRGHDPKLPDAAEAETKKVMEKVVEEDPGLVEGDPAEPEVSLLDPQGPEAVGEDVRENLKLPEIAPK